jgi:hypothetical protein
MRALKPILGLAIGAAASWSCGSDDRTFDNASAGTGGFDPVGGGSGGKGAGGTATGGTGTGGKGGGGTGGGTGTVDCTASPSSGGPTLIDDLEDQDDAIEFAESMRTGWWYTFADDTGTTTPAPGTRVLPVTDPDDAMNYAIRTEGSGHTEWGAGVGVGFRVGTANSCLFSAVDFTGISFRIKGTGTVRFKLPTPDTIDIAIAPTIGRCTMNCGDDFGATIALTPAWVTHTFTWAELRQEGWGAPVAFSEATLTAAEWLVATPSAMYEIYIDDLAFTE